MADKSDLDQKSAETPYDQTTGTAGLRAAPHDQTHSQDNAPPAHQAVAPGPRAAPHDQTHSQDNAARVQQAVAQAARAAPHDQTHSQSDAARVQQAGSNVGSQGGRVADVFKSAVGESL